MLQDDITFRRRVVIIVIMLLVFLVSLIIYATRSNQFAVVSTPSTTTIPLTNPEILQNWLPPVSYKYTLDQLHNYLVSNNITATSMSVQGDVDTSQGAYDFTILFAPQNQTHVVSVVINNYSSTISTSVDIDGQSQAYTIPANNNGTSFSGIDSLVNVGITAVQANELQQAFRQFSSAASTVSIDPNSVVSPPANPDNSTLTNTYGFSVTIDDKKYDAKITCVGLTKMELILNDTKSHKQAFDSGLVDSLN